MALIGANKPLAALFAQCEPLLVIILDDCSNFVEGELLLSGLGECKNVLDTRIAVRAKRQAR